MQHLPCLWTEENLPVVVPLADDRLGGRLHARIVLEEMLSQLPLGSRSERQRDAAIEPAGLRVATFNAILSVASHPSEGGRLDHMGHVHVAPIICGHICLREGEH